MGDHTREIPEISDFSQLHVPGPSPALFKINPHKTPVHIHLEKAVLENSCLSGLLLML